MCVHKHMLRCFRYSTRSKIYQAQDPWLYVLSKARGLSPQLPNSKPLLITSIIRISQKFFQIYNIIIDSIDGDITKFNYIPRMAELSASQMASRRTGSSCQPTGLSHGLLYASKLNASCKIQFDFHICDKMDIYSFAMSIKSIKIIIHISRKYIV